MEPESEFGDSRRRSLFSSHAEQYEDGRPGYPQRVFDHLRSFGLGPGCQVLEIGPGTGQATGPLLQAGADVIAVEVGAELANLLQSKFRQGYDEDRCRILNGMRSLSRNPGRVKSRCGEAYVARVGGTP